MDREKKKEIQAQYKEREVVGGVYAIRNTKKNKLLVEATVDFRGSKNRFEFALETGSCVHLKLQDDWTEQDGRDFGFEVLEELKKGEAQTPAEFKADVDLLRQMWLEKLADTDLY